MHTKSFKAHINWAVILSTLISWSQQTSKGCLPPINTRYGTNQLWPFILTSQQRQQRRRSWLVIRQALPLATYRVRPTVVTVYITINSIISVSHPRGGVQGQLLGNPKGAKYRTVRLRKAPGEMFRTPTFLALTIFQLWKYRPRKIGPGVCDVHRCRRLIYSIQLSWQVTHTCGRWHCGRWHM